MNTKSLSEKIMARIFTDSGPLKQIGFKFKYSWVQRYNFPLKYPRKRHKKAPDPRGQGVLQNLTQ